MDELNLDDALERVRCPLCKTGHTRPTDIHDLQLFLNCSTPTCRWRGVSHLPDLPKTIIYLDTSIVSSIARERQRDKTNSPWRTLHEALRHAVAHEAICCPVSSIVRSEAEFAASAHDIMQIAEELSDPGLRHELDVRHAQVFRALDRFLGGLEPIPDTVLPKRDAFERNVAAWRPVFHIYLNNRYSPSLVESMRSSKATIHASTEDVYRQYADSGIGFEEIRLRESKGFGRGILTDGLKAIEQRALFFSGQLTDATSVGTLFPTTLDLITEYIGRRKDVPWEVAIEAAIDFCRSDYLTLIPQSAIGAKLHAALAMSIRGPTPRKLKPSDQLDMQHIATYMPYADIFIADSFFAAICNRPDLQLGQPYGTRIRGLGSAGIDEFVSELTQLVNSSQRAKIAKRLDHAMKDGGYLREQSARVQMWVQRTTEDQTS